MSYNCVLVSPSAYLGRATGLVSAGHSFAAWFRGTNWTGANYALASLWGFTAGITDGWGVEGPGGGGTFFRAGDVVNGPEPTVTGPGPNFTGWIFICVTVDVLGNLVVYIGTESSAAAVHMTGTIAGIVSDLYINGAAQLFGNQPTNGKYAAVSFWAGTVLTAPQAEAQRLSLTPVTATGLYTYLSCSNGTTIGQDQSGAGHDWTVTGTGITTDADMPTFPGGEPTNSLFFGSCQ